MTSSVSPGSRKPIKQPGLGEDDEAHDEQGPRTRPADDGGRIQPGDEGDVLHDGGPVGRIGRRSGCGGAEEHRAEGGT